MALASLTGNAAVLQDSQVNFVRSARKDASVHNVKFVQPIAEIVMMVSQDPAAAIMTLPVHVVVCMDYVIGPADNVNATLAGPPPLLAMGYHVLNVSQATIYLPLMIVKVKYPSDSFSFLYNDFHSMSGQMRELHSKLSPQ